MGYFTTVTYIFLLSTKYAQSSFENLYKHADIGRAGSELYHFTGALISFSEANYFMAGLE